MPGLWEMTVSSPFPESGKCALPACSEGTALSRAHLSQAERLRSPRGFPEWEEGALGPRAGEARWGGGRLGKDPNFKSQSGKPGQRAATATGSSGEGAQGAVARL